MFWIVFLFIVSGALIIYGGLLSGWRYLHFSFLEPIFNGSPAVFQVWCLAMLIIGAILLILAIVSIFARRKRMMKRYEEYVEEQKKKVEEQRKNKERIEAKKKSFQANRPKYDAYYRDNSISDLRKAELIYKPQVERIANWYSQPYSYGRPGFVILTSVKVSLKGSSIKEGVLIKVSYTYFIAKSFDEKTIRERHNGLLNGICGEFKFYAVCYDPVTISVSLDIKPVSY